MNIILISANGYGAGKTTLANTLIGKTGKRLSLADALRSEVANLYPDFAISIYSKNTKDKYVLLPSGRTVREELIYVGQERCKDDPTYWCKKLLPINPLSALNWVCDDLRKREELLWFREHYQNITHFHLKYSGAIAEKEFDNLEQEADYVIERKDK